MNDKTQAQLVDSGTYFPRVDQYRDWYDSKAVKSKRNYLRAKVASALCAVLVPIVTNIHTLPVIGDVEGAMDVVVTLMGTFVAVMLSLENVFKHKDQWVNYRSTEQFLTREKILFETKSGPYIGVDHDAACHRFIGVCEDAIQNENQATLNILTRDETNNSRDKI
jgi:Protein of unknown function (DUF4231)